MFLYGYCMYHTDFRALSSAEVSGGDGRELGCATHYNKCDITCYATDATRGHAPASLASLYDKHCFGELLFYIFDVSTYRFSREMRFNDLIQKNQIPFFLHIIPKQSDGRVLLTFHITVGYSFIYLHIN